MINPPDFTSDELFDRLEQVARETHMGVTEIIRCAVEGYLDEYENVIPIMSHDEDGYEVDPLEMLELLKLKHMREE